MCAITRQWMRPSPDKPDVIMHETAALPLWKPADIFSTNVDGTRIVLRLAKKHDIDGVVFISSTAVYGVPKKHPLEETDPVVGVGPYGESKIQAEEACVKARADGLCVPIIRPKTFIGTGRLGVFQILCDWVESGTRIPLIGDGSNTYQLLDVEDPCEIDLPLPRGVSEKVNDTYNVGSDDLRPVKEYVGQLCDYAKTGSRIMRHAGGFGDPGAHGPPSPAPLAPVQVGLRNRSHGLLGVDGQDQAGAGLGAEVQQRRCSHPLLPVVPRP